VTRAGAYAGIATGAATVLVWHYVPALKNALYELVPAFLLSLAAVYVVSLLTAPPPEEIRERAAGAARPLPWETPPTHQARMAPTAIEAAAVLVRNRLIVNSLGLNTPGHALSQSHP
jgi:Na+/proline symporter